VCCSSGERVSVYLVERMVGWLHSPSGREKKDIYCHIKEVNSHRPYLADSHCYDTLRFNKRTWMLKAVLLGYDTTSQGHWFPIFWRQHVPLIHWDTCWMHKDEGAVFFKMLGINYLVTQVCIPGALGPQSHHHVDLKTHNTHVINNIKHLIVISQFEWMRSHFVIILVHNLFAWSVIFAVWGGCVHCSCEFKLCVSLLHYVQVISNSHFYKWIFQLAVLMLVKTNWVISNCHICSEIEEKCHKTFS